MATKKGSYGNLQSAWAEPYDQRYTTVLSRTLSSSQTLFMTLNLVLGVGFFQNVTYAVSVAGVAGAVLAVVVVGLVVCCVMDCLLEMVTAFPIANSMVEFVHNFVDREMAHVVGISYWLAYGMFFAAFLISAVNTISSIVDISGPIRVVTTVAIFVVLVAVNLVRVRTFGYLDLATGAAKLALTVSVVAIFASTAALSGPTATSWTKFGTNGYSTKSDAQAIFTASSLIIYPFIGVEGVATMSFETLNPADGLKRTKYVAYMVLVIYLLLTVVIGINNTQFDLVSDIYDNQGMGGIVPVPIWIDSKSYNGSATSEFVARTGLDANVLNGFYTFAAISAASTALYTASRALFGIVRRLIHSKHRSLGIVAQGIGRVMRLTRAPGQAVLVSSLVFIWVALLVARLNHGDHFDIAQTLVSMAINTCVLVWASQCMAYFRYWQWKRQFGTEGDLTLSTSKHPNRQMLHSLQPLPAVVGLLGCLLFVTVFNGSSLWTNQTDFSARFCGAYLSTIIMALLWLLLKLTRFVMEPREEFAWFVGMQDHATYRKTILGLQNQIYPADYAVEDKVGDPSDNSKSTSTMMSGVSDIAQLDQGSRSHTQSSGEAPSEAEPQIAYIPDTGTIEQRPGLTFAVYGSPRLSPRDDPRNISHLDMNGSVRAPQAAVTRFPAIREQSE